MAPLHFPDVKVTSFEELDEELDRLRREEIEELEVEISGDLDLVSLSDLASRLATIEEGMEVEGSFELTGELEAGDLEGPGLEGRVEDLMQRVDDLADELESVA